jgi:non-ribosomal peptide synthetase component F
LGLYEIDGRIVGGIEYATSLFDQETVERYVGYLRIALCEMARDPSQMVAAMPLVSAHERKQLLDDWNDTASDYPAGHCIHEVFEEQVNVNPRAAAVVCEGETLTYEELNGRANRLAHHLRSLGVGPDVVVAICLERGIDMIVGLLGILKAGGAYLPLDPDYPPDRLRFMIEDTAAPVLVTSLSAERNVLQFDGCFVRLDADREKIARLTNSRCDASLQSWNLAYVIYTSGSTGRPKGVAATHQNVVRLVKDTNYVSFD